jgi:hypothetical protein
VGNSEPSFPGSTLQQVVKLLLHEKVSFSFLITSEMVSDLPLPMPITKTPLFVVSVEWSSDTALVSFPYGITLNKVFWLVIIIQVSFALTHTIKTTFPLHIFVMMQWRTGSFEYIQN